MIRIFTDLLLNLLRKEIDKYGAITTLASTTETKDMFGKGAMEKRYEDEKIIRYPSGEAGILACKVNCNSNQEENLALEILPEEGEDITLNLNKTLLLMFYSLLTQGCAQSAWRINEEDTGDVHVVH